MTSWRSPAVPRGGPEPDTLVGLAVATPGVLDARPTGAGFGGCAVALVRADDATAAAATIAGGHRSATGRPGDATIRTPSDGPRSVRLQPLVVPRQRAVGR